MDASAVIRLRAAYVHGEALRTVSHLDLLRVFERAARRARLPLAYTQGFNARPRISMAAPLPVGMSGRHELADFFLAEAVPAEAFAARLAAQLPAGLALCEVGEVPLRAPSLASLLRAARYGARVPSAAVPDGLTERATSLMGEPHIFRTRRGKKGKLVDYDLRPLIESLEIHPADDEDGLALEMVLSALPGATGRPEEVLEALGIPAHRARICRMEMYFAPAEPPV